MNHFKNIEREYYWQNLERKLQGYKVRISIIQLDIFVSMESGS